MVFTGAQTTAFFEEASQMSIPNGTVVQLANEGIDKVDDLNEFDKTSIEDISHNLRRPEQGQPFVFGAKSQKRLIIACDLIRYYETVGRAPSAMNMQWMPVMKNFDIQWTALKAKMDEDVPDTPKITRGLNVMKWSESFIDDCHHCIGVRKVTLAYVIRTVAAVPAACPPIAGGQPHLADAGSIEIELIERASHTHPNFRVDNEKVYFKLEEATCGTSYAASLKPFQRRKDGHGAYLAITT